MSLGKLTIIMPRMMFRFCGKAFFHWLCTQYMAKTTCLISWNNNCNTNKCKVHLYQPCQSWILVSIYLTILANAAVNHVSEASLMGQVIKSSRVYHGWPSTQPGTCTQPCPIVHTAVPPLFTQPCPGRTMSTAVCIYVAGLCASCPAV